MSCQTPPPPHLLVANTPSVSIGSAPHGHWIATNASKSVTGQEKLSVRLNCETSMFSSRGGHGGSEHDNGKNCSDCTKWSHLKLNVVKFVGIYCTVEPLYKGHIGTR